MSDSILIGGLSVCVILLLWAWRSAISNWKETNGRWGETIAMVEGYRAALDLKRTEARRKHAFRQRNREMAREAERLRLASAAMQLICELRNRKTPWAVRAGIWSNQNGSGIRIWVNGASAPRIKHWHGYPVVMIPVDREP